MKTLPLSRNYTGQMLMVVTLALLGLGVIMVHSAMASVSRSELLLQRVDVKHAMFAVLAAGVLLTAWRVDYRRLIGRSGRHMVVPTVALLFSLVCCLLVFVPGIGRTINGSSRWIEVGGGFSFQPSELVKITLLVFLVAYLTREQTDPRSFKTFAVCLGVILLALGPIASEDFGTATVIAAAAIVTLLLAGVRWYFVSLLVPVGAAGFYALVALSDNRWARVQVYLDMLQGNPWEVTGKSAYQPQQSQLAILSGGWFGRGVGNGVQKMGYLPEDTTDFIFSIYCEEFGFLGAVLLMALVLVWVWLVRHAAVSSSNRFGRLLAAALGFLIGMQMILHIAVDVGLLPPTGMSMPFISAGGTALLLMAGAAAMIVSVTAHPDDGPPQLASIK